MHARDSYDFLKPIWIGALHYGDEVLSLLHPSAINTNLSVTNDVWQDDLQHQQERLAALQPEPVKEATLADSLSSAAASVSESVSGFFRSLFYRCAVACLPCWEVLSALSRISLRSAASKKGVNGAAAAGEAELASDEDGSAVIGDGKQATGDSVSLLNEGGKDYGSAANGAGASAVRAKELCPTVCECLETSHHLINHLMVINNSTYPPHRPSSQPPSLSSCGRAKQLHKFPAIHLTLNSYSCTSFLMAFLLAVAAHLVARGPPSLGERLSIACCNALASIHSFLIPSGLQNS